METNHILLKKEDVNGICHVSVIGSYTSKDIAELNCMKHNQSVGPDVHYYLQSVEHNDTTEIEAILEHDEVYLQDDYDNMFFVKVGFANVSNENGEGIESSDATIFGSVIHQMNISEQLQKNINAKCSEAATHIEENIN